MHEDDQLPKKMCKDCVSKLSKSFSFLNQCVEADSILRENLPESKDPAQLMQIIVPDYTDDNECDMKTTIEYIDYDQISDNEQTVLYSNADDTDYLKDEIFFLKNETDDNNDTDDEIKYKNAVEYDCNPVSETEVAGMEKLIESVENGQITKLLKKENSNVKSKPKPIVTRKTEWICQFCSRIFNVRSSYATHVRYHDPIYRKHMAEKDTGHFQCEECGKEFTRNTTYKTHIKLHDPNNPNKCGML